MQKIARILLDVAAIGWLALIATALVMSLSSCGGTKKCCIKTIDEVYKHEGMYVNQEWDRN